MDQAGRGVPVPHGHNHSDRGCNERYVEQDYRKEDKGKGDVVLAGSFPFDVPDLLLSPAGFKAGGTEVLPAEFAITKGTQKASATKAGHDGLLGGVIETGGFSFQ